MECQKCGRGHCICNATPSPASTAGGVRQSIGDDPTFRALLAEYNSGALLTEAFVNFIDTWAARSAGDAVPASTINPMCERKTADIMQREGYEKTGYVLKSFGQRVCVSDGGAVAWFTLEQWNWLIFNRDHIEFAWPKPIGAAPAPGNTVKSE